MGPVVFDATFAGNHPLLKTFDIAEGGSLESAYFDETNSQHLDKVDGQVSSNKGCYGANLSYRITLLNNSPTEPAQATLITQARNIGAKFFGAGRIAQPQAAPFRKLPPIPSQSPPDPPNLRAHNLMAVYPTGVIQVPHPSVEALLEVAVAGGAGTPVNVRIGRAGANPDPGGGRGDE